MFFCRRALDPNDFVMKLGLDPEIQQDAQEFSKLFLTLLESSLQSQSNKEVRNIVQNLVRVTTPFQFKYSIGVVCKKFLDGKEMENFREYICLQMSR